MNSSILYEQLRWALKQEIVDGKSAEAQKEAVKIREILKEALDNEYDNGLDDGEYRS